MGRRDEGRPLWAHSMGMGNGGKGREESGLKMLDWWAKPQKLGARTARQLKTGTATVSPTA